MEDTADIPVLPLALKSAIHSIRKAGESPENIVDGPHCRPSRSPRTNLCVRSNLEQVVLLE
jgi:hypothetical protein